MIDRLIRAYLVGAVALVPAAAPNAHAQEGSGEVIKLETGTGTLLGTRTGAIQTGRGPAVLLLSGSGPTDRDGNSPLLPGANNSLKLLADALAEAGFTIVRYDKRGVGASAAAGPAEADLRFETYASDAVRWVQRLREDPTACSIGIVGHSEGGLVGAVAANQAGVEALVMVASPARPASTVIREQLSSRVDSATYATASRVIATLEAGQTTDSFPPVLWALFRPSVQPYLISWFRYDPAALVAGLDTPTLAVYGTTDIQVPAGDAQIIHAASPRTRLLVIPGMNHVLKSVGHDPTAQQASYSDPALPLAPGLAAGVVEFLEQHLACNEP